MVGGRLAAAALRRSLDRQKNCPAMATLLGATNKSQTTKREGRDLNGTKVGDGTKYDKLQSGISI